MPSPTEKLKHPSVVEAISEFRFARGISYTMVPGAMRERLRPDFPDFDLLPSASLLSGLPEEFLTPPVPHHRFRSHQPNALVQTGPRLLTVNVLPVYPTFEVFREIILRVLDHYKTIADPGNPVRVSLRYLNLIHQADAKELSSLVKCSFSYPQEFPHPPKELAARLLLPYGNLGMLAMALAFPSRIANAPSGALLDLEFYWEGTEGFDLATFSTWLDSAHSIIYEAFTGTVLESVFQAMRG